MKKYLIIGISGAGKTTVAANLSKRGFHTINMDDLETGISFYKNLSTGEYIDRPTPPFDDEWLQQYAWVWDENGIISALNTDNDIFMCGDATNESEFYPLFDKIFGLYVNDRHELIRRLQVREPERWDDNSLELKEKLERQTKEIDRLKESGAILIDASQSPDTVVDDILQHID